MVYTNEKDCFTLSKHSRVCAENFTEGSFEQIIAVMSFLGTLFQASYKKDPVTTMFNFPMESYKPAIGQNLTKT